MSFEQQLQKVKTADGFIAALDQSGGSTPKALRLYGVEESEYSGDSRDVRQDPRDARPDHHQPELRWRDRILGAILFEMTMDREHRGDWVRPISCGGQEAGGALPEGGQGAGG